jgi:endonuclease/exonuclease/phosphatase family metal-dependent hydrolase
MKWKIRVNRRRVIVLVLCLLLLLATPALLFVVNGVLLAWDETPRTGTTNHAPAEEERPRQVKILAYNIAKGFVHNGGLRFEDRAVVAAHIRKVAAIINAERPDLVFLSEVVFECTPCPLNQVVELAEATGMHAWAFGENYNIGLPFYRAVGGNAILSRWPLESVTNMSLAGRRPFYVTFNNRRALWAAAHLGGERILLASLHNDSFSISNNLRQTKQLLAFAGDQPAILAGDFNAKPHERPIKLIQESGFSGAFEGENTFPARKPEKRIDFIFAPRNWRLLDHRVLDGDASDHRVVVSTFRLPSTENASAKSR